MRTNGKNALAVLIILLGALLLLGKFGFVFGHLFGWLLGLFIPLALVALGYIGIRNGSRFFGWLLLILGLVGLAGKFFWLIGLLLGIGLIVCGISLFRRRSTP